MSKIAKGLQDPLAGCDCAMTRATNTDGVFQTVRLTFFAKDAALGEHPGHSIRLACSACKKDGLGRIIGRGKDIRFSLGPALYRVQVKHLGGHRAQVRLSLEGDCGRPTGTFRVTELGGAPLRRLRESMADRANRACEAAVGRSRNILELRLMRRGEFLEKMARESAGANYGIRTPYVAYLKCKFGEASTVSTYQPGSDPAGAVCEALDFLSGSALLDAAGRRGLKGVLRRFRDKFGYTPELVLC